jgi:deoxyribodipyrimidine photolyase
LNDKIVIFWFRRDLRLNDNTGLYHSLKTNSKVLPIFIYDKNTLDKLNSSDHRLDFIQSSLKNINTILNKKNISLDSVVQDRNKGEDFNNIIVLTHETNELDIINAIIDIGNLDTVLIKPQLIRVENI